MLTRAWERRVSVRLVGLRFTKVYEAGFCNALPLEQSDIKRERLHTLSLVVDDLRREHRSIMRGHLRPDTAWAGGSPLAADCPPGLEVERLSLRFHGLLHHPGSKLKVF